MQFMNEKLKNRANDQTINVKMLDGDIRSFAPGFIKGVNSKKRGVQLEMRFDISGISLRCFFQTLIFDLFFSKSYFFHLILGEAYEFVTFSGLSPYQLYNVTICARNSIGCGPVTRLENVVTGYYLNGVFSIIMFFFL